MKVVFLADVQGVANGGEIKTVKAGFARNYLIPKNLATPATREALLRVERLKKHADSERVKTMQDLKGLASQLEGKQVGIPMRAGASGRLYGSVTNAVVSEALSKQIERTIDRRVVDLKEPLREVGSYDVVVKLHADVKATIRVVVHPLTMDAETFLKSKEAKPEGEAAPAPEAEAVAVAAEAPAAEAEAPKS